MEADLRLRAFNALLFLSDFPSRAPAVLAPTNSSLSVEAARAAAAVRLDEGGNFAVAAVAGHLAALGDCARDRTHGEHASDWVLIPADQPWLWDSRIENRSEPVEVRGVRPVDRGTRRWNTRFPLDVALMSTPASRAFA